MGKGISKSERNFAIIEGILLTLLIASLGVYFYFSNKSIILNGKSNVRTTEEDNALLEKQEELDSINKEIDLYNSIDENIDKIKTEYFELLKNFENDVLEGKTDKKIVYLTFDDGPYYNTYKVLDILDNNNVKATFFTTNTNGQDCYDNSGEDCFKVYKEYIKRGHTIANHTYTHGIFRGLYSSTDSFMDAVNKQEEHVKLQTGGYVTNIVRFPGGSSTARGLKDSIINRLREKGYGWVDWTANDGDGGSLSSRDEAWDNFTYSVNDKIEVVLLHDYSDITTSILDDAINYLKENNYVILPLFYESNMINK